MYGTRSLLIRIFMIITKKRCNPFTTSVYGCDVHLSCIKQREGILLSDVLRMSLITMEFKEDQRSGTTTHLSKDYRPLLYKRRKGAFLHHCALKNQWIYLFYEAARHGVLQRIISLLFRCPELRGTSAGFTDRYD